MRKKVFTSGSQEVLLFAVSWCQFIHMAGDGGVFPLCPLTWVSVCPQVPCFPRQPLPARCTRSRSESQAGHAQPTLPFLTPRHPEGSGATTKLYFVHPHKIQDSSPPHKPQTPFKETGVLSTSNCPSASDHSGSYGRGVVDKLQPSQPQEPPS